MDEPPVRVLLVEDNPGDARLLRETLGEVPGNKFELKHVTDLRTALACLAEEDYTLVLLDISLPDAHGLETVTRVRNTAPEAPIVVLTGLNDEGFALHAVREGAQDYLVKGQIDSQLLVRAMKYAIERHRLLSDRKRAAAEIQKLAAFVRYNPNPVFEFSSAGKLTYYNDAAQAMAVSLGKSHPPEILPAGTADIVAECLANGRSRLHLATSVNQRTLSWSFYPIAACQVVHCYASDITERQNLEAQLRQSQRLESVGKLAGGIAHDFNNLLTIIYGHASLLAKEGKQPADIATCAQRISSAAERAANLTRQLLMFSRKQPMQARNLDLRQVIAGIVRMLQPFLGEDITLRVEHAANLPMVFADSSMMEQVIMNLALNARDAMPRGGALSIRTALRSQDQIQTDPACETARGPFVCVTVSDTGHGIAPEILPHIFEPFYTTKDAGQGTGLGLATVYGIVKQHRGWIHVTSEVGTGTTFEVHLPGSTEPQDAWADQGLTRSVPGGSETILIVEDEPPLRELLRYTLEALGYKVLEAESGGAALGVWREHSRRIDLLLSDIVMPGGLSGWELADYLKTDRPDLKILLTSGYNKEIGGRESAIRKGFHFVPKPYRPDEVACAVRDCLDAKHTLSEMYS